MMVCGTVARPLPRGVISLPWWLHPRKTGSVARPRGKRIRDEERLWRLNDIHRPLSHDDVGLLPGRTTLNTQVVTNTGLMQEHKTNAAGNAALRQASEFAELRQYGTQKSQRGPAW